MDNAQQDPESKDDSQIAKERPNEQQHDKDPMEDAAAVTGSPNTVTEVSFDVMHAHLQRPLLGNIVRLDVPIRTKDGTELLLALAQVTDIKTTNRWHEDPSLKNYIKLKGTLPHLTEVGDITTGTLQVLGAYHRIEENGKYVYRKLPLPIPPGSGIPINAVTPDLIRSLMADDTGYGYLGYFSSGDKVPAPVYVKHFGDFADGGSGEAYMGAALGPPGCGKSIIAATLIALWSHNPQLGILIIDPVSEFSKNAFATGTPYDFNFFDLLTRFSHGRFTTKNIVTLDGLQLEGPSLFVSLLERKGFFNVFGVGHEKTHEAVHATYQLLEELIDQGVWNPTMDWQQTVTLQIKGESLFKTFKDRLIEEIARTYAASSRKGRLTEFDHAFTTAEKHLKRTWDESVQFFLSTSKTGKARANLNNIVRDVMEGAAIYIVDINPESHNLGDDFKVTLMDFIFKRLRRRSHQLYASKKPANCLIAIDEAGRFIPQDIREKSDTLRSLTKTLTDSVKELRKNRVGFFFITQYISEIQKDIYRSLHYRIYGHGLSVGVDTEHIKNKEGEDAYELYRTISEPRLSKKFAFMVAGVLLTLGSTGKPMIIEGMPSGEALLLENQHLLGTPEDFAELGDLPT